MSFKPLLAYQTAKTNCFAFIDYLKFSCVFVQNHTADGVSVHYLGLYLAERVCFLPIYNYWWEESNRGHKSRHQKREKSLFWNRSAITWDSIFAKMTGTAEEYRVDVFLWIFSRKTFFCARFARMAWKGVIKRSFVSGNRGWGLSNLLLQWWF